jgi:hypothetical protein
MTGRLGLEIPTSVTTHFVVATHDTAPIGAGYVRDLLCASGSGPLADTAGDLIESPLLVVRGESGVISDWRDRLRGVAGSAEGAAFVSQAPRHIVVASIASPAAQPRHAQAARLVARLLAAANTGVVVDLAARHVVTEIGAAGDERESFVLGDDWLAVFLTCDDEAAEHGRVRVVTAGLGRFGLPELTMGGVQFGSMHTAVGIVRALAVRLVSEHWDWLADHPRDPVWWISRRRCVDGGDVWRYWGAQPLSGGSVWVRLDSIAGVLSDDPVVLEVSPTGDHRGDDWWSKVAAPAIPMLTSPPGAGENGTRLHG